MIFKGIKRKTNQFFFNKMLNSAKSNAADVSSGFAENVLVIIDSSEEESVIVSELLKNIAIEKNNITVLTYQKSKDKNESKENHFCASDFGWNGKIKSESLKNILTNKFDLLINYSKVDNLYCNLLILQSKSAFNIGFSYQNNELFEFMIDCKPGNYIDFNAELVKYLTILNKIKCKN